MGTEVFRQTIPRQPPTPSPTSDMWSIDTLTSASTPIPIPNKHIPYCPPGSVPKSSSQTPITPPQSPQSRYSIIQSSPLAQPGDRYRRILNDPPVYAIDSSTLAAAWDNIASQPLPEPKEIFPWLHGLHSENAMQLAFFSARRKAQRNVPKCYRGMMIVKAGNDLSRSKLKSTINSEDLLTDDVGGDAASFIEIDPKEGFSIRNFQIQVTKMAVLSDIVIYRDETATEDDVLDLARRFALAQETWRIKSGCMSNDAAPRFSTFILDSSFECIAQDYPELVAVDTDGRSTQDSLEFSLWERQEMSTMSKATEIATNVWLGPTPDSLLCTANGADSAHDYDIMIDTSDSAQAPSAEALRTFDTLSRSSAQHIEFPASGSIIPEYKAHSDALIRMCTWIHKIACPTYGSEAGDVDEQKDIEGDISMQALNPRARKILIHCNDGYTESTLLAVAYFMYAECQPLHEALIRLHCEKQRNFFAYPSDITLLRSIQSSLISTTPHGSRSTPSRSDAAQTLPMWINKLDGSLPSRILPYMYLGNLSHANNPELLKAMGINRILSVGEPVSWSKAQLDTWGHDNILNITGVQDNGVDPLMKDFDRCLDFISNEDSSTPSRKTLVHCRVGVSRSATICIAEVMSSLGLSFPRAYCFVRARRLNVIIQPHLRFAYELMKWDELCQQRREGQVKREMEWAVVAREVAGLNRPYCRG